MSSFDSRLGRRLSIAGLLATALVTLTCGCGGPSARGDSSTHVLSTKEARRALLQLPYKYSFRRVSLPEGATGALAGKAIGRYHTKLEFGVALGKDPKGVPVPQAGTGEAYGYLYGGFIYTNDLQIPNKRHKWVANPRFHTGAQWNEAINISVAMEEKLCRAATGEPCHEGE